MRRRRGEGGGGEGEVGMGGEEEKEEERTASCARHDLEIYHSFLLHLVGHVYQLLVKLK